MSHIAVGPREMGPMRLGPVWSGPVRLGPSGWGTSGRGSTAAAVVVAAAAAGGGGVGIDVGRPPTVSARRRGRVRWGRVTVLVLTVLLAVAAVVAATGGVAESAPQRGDGAVVQRMTALQEHVVAPGDTVWSLALAAAPDGDPREMVDRIMRLNGLTAGDIQVGDVVLVPNRR